MSSWMSTTLEVPGASSTFSYRGSSPSSSPLYQPLPTFEGDSDSNAGSSIEILDEKRWLSHDSEEAAKLHDRDLGNTRRTRFKIGTALAATAITALYLLLPSCRSAPGVLLPLQCGNTTFAEPGWILQSHGKAAETQLSLGLQMLDAQKQTSLACADLWVSRGEICETIRQGHVKLTEPRISAVWSYSNPASPHYKAWLANSALAGQSAPVDPAEPALTADQLRYSMRSVMQNLPFLQQAIVRVPSLPMGKPGEPSSSCFIAQVPTWLDIGKTTSVQSKLKLLPYQLFTKNASTANSIPDAITQSGDGLPRATQQSNEVDYYLFLNSSQYVRRELSAADFASPLYGPVFRFASSRRAEDPSSAAIHKLLATRFGMRYRDGLHTTADALSSPMLNEIERVWPDRTAKETFSSNSLLSTLYTMEKHREALLWSFLVAKSDADGSGTYSQQERQAILAALKSHVTGSLLEVKTMENSTKNERFHPQEKLKEAGLSPAKATRYIQASSQGIPILPHGQARHLERNDTANCRISISKCFGTADFFAAAGSISVDNTFKRIAFQRLDCGGCIIAALVAASGHTGLEAFLPSRLIRRPRTLRSRKAAEETVPYIGGTARGWREADFSLKTAIGSDWKPRDFAVRLIQRYSYVIGESSYLDWTFGKTGQDERAFEDSIRKSDPASLTLATGSAGDAVSANAEEAHRALEQYQEAAWPVRMAYEL